MNLSSFEHHFGQLEDQRQSAKMTYPLFDILFTYLCAMISGANGWKEIKEYADGHLDWFKANGFLLDGIPVDDTIARTIAKIKPNEFNQRTHQGSPITRFNVMRRILSTLKVPFQL